MFRFPFITALAIVPSVAAPTGSNLGFENGNTGMSDSYLNWLWQPEARSQKARQDPAFQGFGQITTQSDGQFRFITIKPAPYPAPNGRMRAPHIHFSIIGTSWMDRMVTQMYFPGEPLNDFDMLLNGAPDGTRRARDVVDKRPFVPLINPLG